MKKPFKTLVAGAIGLMAAMTGAQAADVVIGVPNWPSVRVTAHVLKVIMEENLGLDVSLQEGTNPVIFEAMDRGSMQVHPEVWLPNQNNLNNTYVSERGTVAMNSYGIPAFQGLCVNKFAADEHGVTSIYDLTDPDKAALFDTNGDGRGEVWIGASGWASTNVEKVRAQSYGYVETMELMEMDETLALAAVDAAVAASKPIVFFCYTPHHMFALHELVVLEEPAHDPATWNMIQPTDDPDWLAKSKAETAWDLAYLHIHFAKELETSQPEAAALLSSVKLDTDTVSAMTFALVVEKQDPAEFAAQWVADNQDQVSAWLGQ